MKSWHGNSVLANRLQPTQPVNSITPIPPAHTLAPSDSVGQTVCRRYSEEIFETGHAETQLWLHLQRRPWHRDRDAQLLPRLRHRQRSPPPHQLPYPPQPVRSCLDWVSPQHPVPSPCRLSNILRPRPHRPPHTGH